MWENMYRWQLLLVVYAVGIIFELIFVAYSVLCLALVAGSVLLPPSGSRMVQLFLAS